MFPAVDVAAGTMEMEDGPREEGTKEEPDKFEEDENLALEHLSGVSLSTDTTGLRDDLVAEAFEHRSRQQSPSHAAVATRLAPEIEESHVAVLLLRAVHIVDKVGNDVDDLNSCVFE